MTIVVTQVVSHQGFLVAKGYGRGSFYYPALCYSDYPSQSGFYPSTHEDIDAISQYLLRN